MIKNEVRKELEKNGLYSIEVYKDLNEELPIEYYCWYNMIISFHKSRKNKLFVKFEGEIPLALIEYINKKYPENKIIINYSKNIDIENIKYCNNILIKKIKDLEIFLNESKKFWISFDILAKEMLEQEKTLALKNR